jgi:hypothetical protein
MRLVYIGDLVAVGRRVLPVEFIQEGVALGVLPDGPVGMGSFIHALGLMSARARCASIALIEPRL